ncbi:MAG: zinc ribbon domain-containing protein [Oscillospiraceae bacterium]|jgi:hypothetical protein|nr:zinc ribbon domain-containing protein [Oscillospiraceae bacterium]
MTCPNCGAFLDDGAQYCNRCGQAQRQQESPPEPPGCAYQQPTGDQGPRQVFNNTGGTPFGGDKAHLILSLCCFGWAGLIGLPKAISFLVTLVRWDWGPFSWPPISGWFSVAAHFVLPLVGGVVLLGMHRRNSEQ